jgi:hypothetical protein
LLLVEPIGRRAARSFAFRRFAPPPRRTAAFEVVLLFAGIQFLVTAYAARVAGFAHNPGKATALLLPVLVLAAIVSCFMPLPPRIVKRV